MTFLVTLFLVPFTILTLCFAIEVIVGLKPLTQLPYSPSAKFNWVIVVPAHDEEAVLAKTLEQLNASTSGGARILLVADNCNDATAQIGRDAGVEVIERNEPARKGKGFALDFARTYLSSQPPDVVVVIDADCSIDSGSLSCLAKACVATGRPCQATNLQQPSPDASPAVQLSTFAFFIRNVIRQRALSRLAGRTHLLGTGMAFPWPVFARAELATSDIVEDLRIGHELANAGYAPVFVEGAAVWSRAESDANTISQRRRWEGGFLQNAKRAAPKMWAEALSRKDVRLMWAAIDLMIPPFALLILLDVLALGIAAVMIWLASAHLWPVLFPAGSLAIALLALALAWTLGGHRFVSLRSLATAPLYVAWKLPIYIGFARRGPPKEWARTQR